MEWNALTKVETFNALSKVESEDPETLFCSSVLCTRCARVAFRPHFARQPRAATSEGSALMALTPTLTARVKMRVEMRAGHAAAPLVVTSR